MEGRSLPLLLLSHCPHYQPRDLLPTAATPPAECCPLAHQQRLAEERGATPATAVAMAPSLDIFLRVEDKEPPATAASVLPPLLGTGIWRAAAGHAVVLAGASSLTRRVAAGSGCGKQAGGRGSRRRGRALPRATAGSCGPGRAGDRGAGRLTPPARRAARRWEKPHFRPAARRGRTRAAPRPPLRVLAGRDRRDPRPGPAEGRPGRGGLLRSGRRGWCGGR